MESKRGPRRGQQHAANHCAIPFNQLWLHGPMCVEAAALTLRDRGLPVPTVEVKPQSTTRSTSTDLRMSCHRWPKSCTHIAAKFCAACWSGQLADTKAEALIIESAKNARASTLIKCNVSPAILRRFALMILQISWCYIASSTSDRMLPQTRIRCCTWPLAFPGLYKQLLQRAAWAQTHA